MPADAEVPSTAPAIEVPGASGRSWLVPVAAMALLGLLAAWGLDHRSFWIDEGISAGATNELVATWTGTGGTMALYYLLLTPWSWVSMDPAWLRGLSALFALAAVPAIWLVACRAFDRRIATLATLFTATSWVVVRYAQEARSYSLVLLLTSMSWLALVSALRSHDDRTARRWWLTFAVVTIIAPLAHGLAVLQFAAQAAWLLIGPRRSEAIDRLKPVFIGVALVMSVLVVGGASDIASWIPPLSTAQLHDMAAAFTGPGLCGLLVLGGATLLGAGVCLVRRRDAATEEDAWFAVLPLAWGLVPVALLLVLSVARPYFLARYAMASAPGIGLLLAFAVLDTRPRVTVLRAGLVLIPVVAFLAVGQVELHRDAGDDWAGAATEIADEARPGDAIYIVNPSVRSAFDYAWLHESSGPHAVVPTAFSPVEPLGDLRRFYLIVDPRQAPKAAADADHQRLWVIDQAGESLVPEIDAFLRHEEVQQAYRTVSDRRFEGGVRVVLLERR